MKIFLVFFIVLLLTTCIHLTSCTTNNKSDEHIAAHKNTFSIDTLAEVMHQAEQRKLTNFVATIYEQRNISDETPWKGIQCLFKRSNNEDLVICQQHITHTAPTQKIVLIEVSNTIVFF